MHSPYVIAVIVYNLNMSAADIFIGREHEIRAVKSEWSTHNVFGIFGLRSIGKSRFVKECLIFLESEEWNFTWIDMKHIRHARQVYLGLRGSLSQTSVQPESDWTVGIRKVLQSCACSKQVIILDNAENIVDIGLDLDLQKLCNAIISGSETVKLFVTSAMEFTFEMKAFSLTLPPLSPRNAAALLQAHAPSVDFGSNMATIVDLCGGFPLALLMTSSILDNNDAMFTVDDVVELLQLCRLNILSQDVYPRQERVGNT